MNKRGFELSVNFIVIIILCIAVFSFGIYFIAKIGEEMHKQTLQLDQQTQKEIDSLLDTGDRVVIPRPQRTVERGNLEVFGVGVLNILGISEYDKFKVTVSFNEGVCDGTCSNPLSDSAISGTELGEEIIIKNNENHKFAVGINVPKNTGKGTYIFNVVVEYYNTVSSDWETYGGAGTLYKIRVTVK